MISLFWQEAHQLNDADSSCPTTTPGYAASEKHLARHKTCTHRIPALQSRLGLHADGSVAAHLAAQLARARAATVQAVALDVAGVAQKLAAAVDVGAAVALLRGGARGRHAPGVREERGAGRLDDFLGLVDGVLEGLGGRVGRGRREGGGAGAACLLGAELADVLGQPEAVELRARHLLGAVNGAAAGGRAAEALEGLGHFPLRGGVEELIQVRVRILYTTPRS